jgi:hypothetical protein
MTEAIAGEAAKACSSRGRSSTRANMTPFGPPEQPADASSARSKLRMDMQVWSSSPGMRGRLPPVAFEAPAHLLELLTAEIRCRSMFMAFPGIALGENSGRPCDGPRDARAGERNHAKVAPSMKAAMWVR